jgi:hypothetical protein
METRARFLRELARSRLPSNPGASAPVTEAELETLPEPARRFLRFMGVVGRPRDWSFRAGFEGWFRLKAHRRFMACEAWLYANRLGLARFFHIRARFGYVIPVMSRETYAGGRGRRWIRLCDLAMLEDDKGPECDASELIAYLNDTVLIAPSMLLVPEVAWSAVDGTSFALAITGHGRTVSARVLVDERGAPMEFTTMDRYCPDPDNYRNVLQTRWTTPVTGWGLVEGRRIFTSVEARWHLPQGLFTYANFRPIPGSFAFNVAPGQ